MNPTFPPFLMFIYLSLFVHSFFYFLDVIHGNLEQIHIIAKLLVCQVIKRETEEQLKELTEIYAFKIYKHGLSRSKTACKSVIKVECHIVGMKYSGDVQQQYRMKGCVVRFMISYSVLWCPQAI